MGKGKLEKFADMAQYENVFQCPYSALKHELALGGTIDDGYRHEMAGRWGESYFRNQNPIVLELGCGKGEYTVALARQYPDHNFIGVDIKGARMWTGTTEAREAGLGNVAFLRTNIEIIDRFFAPDEVQEIWLTFSDPQMKNPRKRLTSSWFQERYRHFLSDGGIIHLKTDSQFLFTYTRLLVEKSHLPVSFSTSDLYGDPKSAENVEQATLAVQTYYEQMWRSRGIPIKYIRWQLPHESRLEEPDVEIELDDYRSYHRTKRSSLDKAK